VCYYGGCVPLAVIVYHWTVVVCYYGGCVPLDSGCVPLDNSYVLLWFGNRLDGIVVVVRY
jgi:hypothetical protein